MIGVYEVGGQTLIIEEEQEYALVILQLPEVATMTEGESPREFLQVRLQDYTIQWQPRLSLGDR